MSKHLRYRGQLDGIRAISIFIVLLSHWLRDAGILNFNSSGRYGVDLFFVLSGFLLTSILIRQKKQNINRLKIIKGFFIKRILRLFPAYYLFLIGMIVINLVTGFWIWDDGFGAYYFTYTANFLFYFED